MELNLDELSHLTGGLTSPRDYDDLVYEDIAMGDNHELPTSFDWLKYSSTPRDQGSRGTCAAFVGAYIQEIYAMKTGDKMNLPVDNFGAKKDTCYEKTSLVTPLGTSSVNSPKTSPMASPTIHSRAASPSKRTASPGRQPVSPAHSQGPLRAVELSPEFIYYHRVNKPAPGMFGRNVFQILRSYGCPPEELFPYCADESTFPEFGKVTAQAPSKKIYKIAAEHKINNFARIMSPSGLKSAVYYQGPCFLLLPLVDRRVAMFWRGGSAKKKSSHAVCVVGYNEDGFILKNSWGNWNNDGYCLFPYTDWLYHEECWCALGHIDSGKAETPEEKKRECYQM